MSRPWSDAEATPILLTVQPDAVGQRLDRFITDGTEMTRSAVTKLIEDGSILVNGKAASKNYRVALGDTVSITIPEPVPCEAIPENIPLDVVFEDDDLIVINKPCGMVVHPAAGNPSGTLVNALLFHCNGSLSGIGGVVRPGIVHRIDKDTSGLLVVAKNDETHLALAEQLKGHHISRVYYAIAIGNVRDENGTVNAPIGRHPIDRKKMAVIRNQSIPSREAVTHWQVLARAEADGQCFTLLRCELETGRTHQIRVHMSSIGHPLLGDPVYGGASTRFEARHKALIQGQCLHAGQLHFVHPTTKQEVTFHTPLPPTMQRVVEVIFGADTAKDILS